MTASIDPRAGWKITVSLYCVVILCVPQQIFVILLFGLSWTHIISPTCFEICLGSS